MSFWVFFREDRRDLCKEGKARGERRPESMGESKIAGREEENRNRI